MPRRDENGSTAITYTSTWYPTARNFAAGVQRCHLPGALGVLSDRTTYTVLRTTNTATPTGIQARVAAQSGRGGGGCADLRTRPTRPAGSPHPQGPADAKRPQSVFRDWLIIREKNICTKCCRNNEGDYPNSD
jgi:hypothetical protein